MPAARDRYQGRLDPDFNERSLHGLCLLKSSHSIGVPVDKQERGSVPVDVNRRGVLREKMVGKWRLFS